MKARLSSRAFRDLAEITEYINSDNPIAADRFLERIDEIGVQLAATHDLGFEHEDLPQGVHYWPIGKYVVFYRAAACETLILRIIHSARDWSALIQDPNP